MTTVLMMPILTNLIVTETVLVMYVILMMIMMVGTITSILNPVVWVIFLSFLSVLRCPMVWYGLFIIVAL